MNDIIDVINDNQLGEIHLNESMKYHTTMRVGGHIEVLYIPNSIDSLLKVLKHLKQKQLKYKIIGRGSNCVFPDHQMDGMIIKISNVLDYLEINEAEIVVGAGCSLIKLAKHLSKLGYEGLEFAGGIPGSVGGATVMNAGAHLHSMADIIDHVKIITKDGEIVTLNNQQCQFSYRSSIFQQQYGIIVEITFKMHKSDDDAYIFKKMAGNLAYRQEMQPLDLPSCGSTFRNPSNNHAGKLIDQAGLKGHLVGGMQVSEKHANFIVNVNEGTTADLKQLINEIIDQVKKQTKIVLESEIEIVEDFDE